MQEHKISSHIAIALICALVLFIVVICVFFRQISVAPQISTSKISSTIVENRCDIDQCLIKLEDDQLVGYGWITGYYHRDEYVAGIEGEKFQCDGVMVASDTPSALFNYLVGMDGGPGNIHIQSDGELFVGLYDSSTLEKTRAKLVSSNPESPVQVKILIPAAAGYYKDGAWGICGLRVKVIDIKD